MNFPRKRPAPIDAPPRPCDSDVRTDTLHPQHPDTVAALYRPTTEPPLVTALFDVDTLLIEQLALDLIRRQKLLRPRQHALIAMGFVLPGLLLVMGNRDPRVWAFAACVAVLILILALRLPGSVARISVHRALNTPGALGPQELILTPSALIVRRQSSQSEIAFPAVVDISPIPTGLVVTLGQGQGHIVPNTARLSSGTFDQFQTTLLTLWRDAHARSGTPS